jgi:hypothetical protein
MGSSAPSPASTLVVALALCAGCASSGLSDRGRTPARPLICDLSVSGSTGLVVRGARVTCGGARASFDTSSQTYRARGAIDRARPGVLVEITHPRFVPLRRRLPAGTTRERVALRRPDEPFLMVRGVEVPLPVRRDRLLLVLDDRDDQRTLAAVTGLLTRQGLVVAPLAVDTKVPPQRCSNSPPWQMVIARADGRDFLDRGDAALAALRANPFIMAAGPLIEYGSGHGLVDRTIYILGKGQGMDLPESLRAYIHVLGLTLDPSERTISLPPSMGLHAIAISNQLHAIAPDLDLVLRLGPGGICTA